jgi:precorrin-2 dehydrogenase/sirohydrochlorin ferrochelatase
MSAVNKLYPIFLKPAQLDILLVGGGIVALEKLQFLFKSSPDAKVTLVSPMLRKETATFIKNKKVTTITAHYHSKYLEGKHLVIATTNKPQVNQTVQRDCRARHILVNVADVPDRCDFYMGGIVTKGQLKIAISTNGQSPTLAKRMRQWLEYLLPEDIDNLLTLLNTYRNTLKTDFENKVKTMEKITQDLIAKQ